MISSAENSKSSRSERIRGNNVFGNEKPTLDHRGERITRKEHWRNGLPLIFCESGGTKYNGLLHRPKGNMIVKEYKASARNDKKRRSRNRGDSLHDTSLVQRRENQIFNSREQDFN